MRNSSYNTNSKSDQSIKKQTSLIDNRRKNSNDNVERDEYLATQGMKKVHSITDLPHIDTSSKLLQDQIKASSTPNVSFISDTDKLNGNNTSTYLLKKSLLEPIKSKKRKGLLERLSQNPNDNKMMSVSLDSNMINNKMDSISLNASVDSRRGSYDTVSIASFSNNNDLSPADLVLKHLAYRSSAVDISNKIERYKVSFLFRLVYIIYVRYDVILNQ